MIIYVVGEQSLYEGDWGTSYFISLEKAVHNFIGRSDDIKKDDITYAGMNSLESSFILYTNMGDTYYLYLDALSVIE